MSINWIYLITAGIIEVGWVISLKQTEGFTKVIPIIFYAVFGFTGAYLFSLSMKHIPMGIAYAVWMGIAVIGTIVYESFIVSKSYDLLKIFFILLIIIGVIGLKLTSNQQLG